MKWKCKDGRVLELHEIETGHLKNIIAWLRRKGVVSPDVYFSCLAYSCSANTPDGAAMAAETEWMGMKPGKAWSCLKQNLRKGKINESPHPHYRNHRSQRHRSRAVIRPV